MYSNAFNSLSRFILTNVGVFSILSLPVPGPRLCSLLLCFVRLIWLQAVCSLRTPVDKLILNDIHILLAVYKPKFDFIPVTKQRSKPVIF